MTATSWKITMTEGSTDSLTVAFSDGAESTAQSTMTAADVEKLIHALAAFRMRMTPEVSQERPAKFNPTGPANPLYAALDVPVLPGKMLMIRHEGLGWLSFLFPQHEADKLAHGLKVQIAAPTGAGGMQKH